MIGSLLYGRMGQALTLLAIFIVSGLTLIYVVNHLWTPKVQEPEIECAGAPT